MRFVKRCGMEDGLDAMHAAAYPGAVGNGADVRRERRLKYVQANHLILQIP
jgi:hypothetical protein